MDLGEQPRFLVRAALAAEDRRFYAHPGFDPVAMGRAAVQNAFARRIVSEMSMC
ncbi:MAG TPA: transglycosylase domain-containing protein [Spirochaetota bacterium]|nr:transglycosylase domain-containing protein [Spirochaetota bacterium]